MTTMPQQNRPRPSDRPTTGRPIAFALILVLAALIALWVLISGPSLPLAAAIAAVGVVLALLAAGWRFAGPRG